MPELNIEPMLDSFQKTLEGGLLKICSMAGLASEMLVSPDMDGRWDALVKDYVADAVENFNEYPNAALGFAAYLGMAVACDWDTDWKRNCSKKYSRYCGKRGFDDMDDYICDEVLHLDPERKQKIASCLLACVDATLGLIKHENIEVQTKYGFFVLVRCYTAMFRLGCSIELASLGYRMEALNPKV